VFLVEGSKLYEESMRKYARDCSMEKEERVTMARANPIEVEKSLKGISFPAKKEDLVKHARKQGADQDVLETIKNLPEEEFHNAVDVTKAIGEMDRQ
jgi:hypothetical protein